MKKFFSFLLICTILSSLVGCSDTGDRSNSNSISGNSISIYSSSGSGNPVSDVSQDEPVSTSSQSGDVLSAITSYPSASAASQASVPGSAASSQGTPTATPIPEIKTPQVWTSAFSPYLLADTSKWDYTSKNLDTLTCFIDDIAAMDADQTEAFCSMIKKTGRKLAIECGGLCPWLIGKYAKGTNTFATESVLSELYRIAKLQDYGVTPDFLIFDDPYWRALYPDGDILQSYTPAMSIQEATTQIVHVMKYWKEIYPDIQFTVNPNFPNWGWKSGMAYFPYFGKADARGDYFLALDDLVKQSNASGIKIFGVIADCPYEYATGVKFPASNPGVDKFDWWGRLLDLEKETEKRGLLFGIHFNSQDCGISGTDQQYYKVATTYINSYISKGGSPAIFSVEAWWKPADGGHPSLLVPETTPYTTTFLAYNVIKYVKDGIALDPQK